MKRPVLSVMILLAVLLVLAEAFAAVEREGYKSVARSRPVRSGGAWGRKAMVDANSLDADLEFLADANAVRSRLKEFEGLEKALEKVSRVSQRTAREWASGPIEERIDLAKTVEKQAIAELSFIRELAVEEKAQKTVAAVDGLLLDRQERYKKLVKKVDLSMKRMRRNEWNYRPSRRDMLRNRYRERDRYEQMYREQDREWERERDRQGSPTRARPSQRGTREQDDSAEY